ncbi:MAG: response regulator transcription factor [Chloroflexota bacterium]
MRILLVEDEPGIADFIRQGLVEAAHAVDVAVDGLDGLAYATSAEYDVLILDIMLPKLNGLDLMEELRRRDIRVPTLMLTARDTVDDRVAGLNAGADDYLVKPFAFAELLARVRALLRRPPLQSGSVLSMMDLELDTVHHQVRRGGCPIELSPKEFAMLEYLMRHPNQVLSRTQIGEHVWNFDFYNESNVVDVYIGYLRRKIDKEHRPRLIHTVRGVGYRIGEDL